MGLFDFLNKDKRNQDKADRYYKRGIELMKDDLYLEALYEFNQAKKFTSTQNITSKMEQCWSALNYNITKHLEKNGLGFDYPAYYHVAKYENKNPAYKNSIGLTKKGTLCEIYIMKRADLNFDERYKPYIGDMLERNGYKNVKKIYDLPNAYSTRIKYYNHNIKSIISYNFDYTNTIEMVGNVPLNSKYNCIDDMKIISKSLEEITNRKSKDNKWKICPFCGHRLNKAAINCGICGNRI